MTDFLAQAQALWIGAGGPAWAAPTAAAIAAAESGSGTQLLGDYSAGSPTSFGLWQIHTPAHPQYDAAQLINDPAYNAKAAVDIFNAAGQKFGDWSTYTNGAYLTHLGEANAVAPAASSGMPQGQTAIQASGPTFAPVALAASTTTMIVVFVVLVIALSVYGAHGAHTP